MTIPLLDRWMNKTGTTTVWLAAQIGLSTEATRAIRRGDVLPTPELREKIFAAVRTRREEIESVLHTNIYVLVPGQRENP